MPGQAIDLKHLARYTGGDVALNSEVLGLFTNQAAELIAKLQTVLETRDLKTWKEITHSLKGAARGIGAFGFADAAAAAEPFDLAGQADEAGRALAELRTNAEAVQIFIRAYLGR